jgi:NADP-dependent 3-hydroxy acid dehydrogenase YdfG
MSSTTEPSAGLLRGRTAFITGASRGIGFECARALSRAGAFLWIVARDLSASSVLLKHGIQHVAFEADLADRDRVVKLVDELRTNWGTPDIVVNNAAQFFLAPIEETRLGDFDRLMRINVTSHFALIQHFLAGMRARGSGDIVTIGSIADVRPLEGNAAYSSSKFAARGLHGVLREETRGSGIRATLVSPGRVDTDMWQGIDAGARTGQGPRAGMIAAHDVADAVLFVVTRPPTVNIDELRLSRT